MFPCNTHIVFFFIQLHCLQLLVQLSIILGEPASFSPTFSGRNLVTSPLSLQAGGRCPAWVLQKCLPNAHLWVTPFPLWLELPTVSSFLRQANCCLDRHLYLHVNRDGVGITSTPHYSLHDTWVALIKWLQIQNTLPFRGKSVVKDYGGCDMLMSLYSAICLWPHHLWLPSGQENQWLISVLCLVNTSICVGHVPAIRCHPQVDPFLNWPGLWSLTWCLSVSRSWVFTHNIYLFYSRMNFAQFGVFSGNRKRFCSTWNPP